jgi:hypothetical protein
LDGAGISGWSVTNSYISRKKLLSGKLLILIMDFSFGKYEFKIIVVSTSADQLVVRLDRLSDSGYGCENMTQLPEQGQYSTSLTPYARFSPTPTLALGSEE